MNISKMKPLLLFALVFFLFSCQNTSESKGKDHVVAEITSPDFDRILKCKNYTYEENYFLTADAGCLYNPKGENTFGNLITYLIPKKALNINEDNSVSETKKVNNLSIAQLKEDFNIYVYVIDKKYLNYNKTGDPVYYQKDDFAEDLYTYDSKSRKWSLIDSVSVTSTDHTKEQTWRDGFIQKQVTQLTVKPTKVSTAGKISEKWYGTYSFTTNEDKEDWREQQKVSLLITKDSIIYHAEGYQIDQTYQLSGKENGGALMLDYLNAAGHTESAVLDKTKDFGTIVNENKSYTWSSPYLDLSFGGGKSKVYVLKKK
ncbi:hypothetical protein HDE68_001256 [Pedobacter cryoconitis]|uniref:Lipoprotein n=1 Tax=Pedobacter cryoconitis TaxID=188932 RepID=A0A7W8ZKC3_9SPHI|nr:hypothetical protein [Pedobacter cryoconitis]MBB5635368.1 hypothetical protein [Pedobacter cryoconitis]